VNRYAGLFLAIALVWILQLGFSLLQTRRFHKRVFQLRKEGNQTSVGMSGSTWKRKVYGVLVVDEARTILRAEKLSGFTVFASLQPVPELGGKPMSVLDQDEPVAGLNEKLWKAFQNAAGFIKNKDSRSGDA
jgi:DNA-binding transcriptional regulator of glucitol operon